MAHFYRVVFALFICCFSVCSFAYVLKSGGGPISSYKADPYCRGCTGWRDTIAATSAAGACASAAVSRSAFAGGFTAGASTETTCDVMYGPDINWQTGIVKSTVIADPVCPSNSVTVGDRCYCSDGYKDSSTTSTSCESDADAAKCAGQSGSTDNNYTRTAAAGTSSDVCPSVGGGSNCTVKIVWDVTYSINGVRGQSGVGKYTGSTCSSTTTTNAQTAAAATPPSSPAPIPAPGTTGAPAKNDCPAGSYPGTVNGVFRCAPPSGTDPVSTTGTTTTTSPTAPGAAADKTSTKKDVTCSGATCTTTTTTTVTPGSGGAATTTTATTQQPKEDFCTLNPKATQCITSSYGSGSCGSAPPSCSGDAIQCGIALQSWQTQCALNPTPGQEVEAYNAAKTITGSVTGALPGSGDVAIGAGSFDQTSHFASVGLTDMQLQIAGKEFNVKFSLLNTWLELLGNLGVAVTLLVAIRISLGGAI